MSNHCLIVEDDILTCNLFRVALQKAGFTVSIAQNSEKAINILQSNWVHVLIVDLRLPGMSGTELIERIRDVPEFDQMKIVIVSASRDLYQMPVNRLVDLSLQKPVNIHEMVDNIIGMANNSYRAGV